MVAPTALFSTVPAHDYLQFWQAGRFQAQRVARFLNLSKEDVAHLAGIAVSSVRFDRKAPHDLIERLTEVAMICTLVAQAFEGSAIKTALWFKTANPLLGGASPRDMIRAGRQEQLRGVVLEALSESAKSGSMAPSAAPGSRPIEAGERSSAQLEQFVQAHREPLGALCARFGVRRLAAFGSMLRADFDPLRSDVDLAVEFAPVADRSPAHQYFDFKSALEALFGRPVDLIELSAMPDSRLRRIIERTQVPIYAEAA